MKIASLKTCLLLIGALAALASSGSAAQVTFTGPFGGQWTTATNWSGSAVPTSSDDAILNATNQVFLNLSSGNQTIANLTGNAAGIGTIRVYGQSSSTTNVFNVTGAINLTNNSSSTISVATFNSASNYYAIQTPSLTVRSLNVLSSSWLTAGPGSTWNVQSFELNGENSANRANFRVNGATVNVNELVGDGAYGLMLTRSAAETATLYVDSGTLSAKRIGIGRKQADFQNAGTGNIEWTGGTIRNFSGSDLLINSYDITDNYGLQINLSGAGTKTLTADSTRTIRVGANSTNISTGTNQNTSGAYFTGSTGTLLLDGPGTVRLYQSNSYTGQVKIDNGTLTLVSGSETYAGVSGTYSGSIAPSALEIATNGTLDLQNGTGLGGSGTVSFTGGLLRFSSNSVADLSGRIVNSTGAIRIDTGTNTVNFASGLASNNTGGLTKTGSGTLVLSGANTYNGTTTITAGTLRLGAANTIPAGSSVTINGGTLDNSGNANTIRSLTITSGSLIGSGTMTVAPGGGVSLSGTGILAANLTTPGDIVVSTTNSAADYYAIQSPSLTAKDLVVKSNSWLTAGPGSTWNFGGLDLNTDSSASSANFRINGATVNVGNGNAYSVMLSRGTAETSTLYMDSGTLATERIGMGRKQANFQNPGTGTLEWTGGTIRNKAGTDLLFNSYDTVDTTYGLQINLTGAGNKTLTADSGRTIRVGPNSVNDSTGTTQNTGGAYFTGSTGTLLLDGPGTVRLYQSNSYTGQVKIDNGTLTLVSGSETYAGVSGTYSGSIAPSALEIATNGTLDLQNGTGLGGSGTVSFTGGLLRFSSNSVADLSGRIVNSTGAIRIDTGANTVTFASGLDSNNTGGLTKTGSGTLVLSGTNTYTGDTTISNGAIALTSSGALRFVIGGSGTNNALKGNGATSVNGQFVFDLSGASTNTNATWTIVAASLNPTYETGFRVADFIRDGLGNWNKETNGVRYIFSQSNGVLSVQSIAGVTPYNAWVNSWPGFTQTAGTDDPDGDGYNNNMEFAFGTIPTAGSSALLRTATSGGQFVISWLQRIDSSSNYKVEEATDLVAGSWVTSSARVQSGSGATPPDGYEWKQISVTPTGKKFYRVQATIAP